MTAETTTPLITTTDELNEFCKLAARSDALGVDTEFILEKRYWPELCLVQLATTGVEKAVDTKAKGLDLSPLYELLHDQRVTKILHSSREDVLIFHHLTGELPSPIFDTQLAAMFTGYGTQPGYANLVKQVVGKNLDKSQQLTDWAKRPLTDRQIEYAINDVRYLLQMHVLLERKLKQLARTDWCREELAHHQLRQAQDVNPYERWRRLHLRQATPARCGVLREVVAWRELYAQRHDLPVRWIIGDFPLIEIAQNPPTTLRQFNELRFLPQSFRQTHKGDELFKAVSKGLNLPADQLPEPPRDERAHKENGGVLSLLNLLLNQTCEQERIASQLVAVQNDLHLLAGGGVKYNRITRGWRKQIFGDEAQRLLNGEISFKVVGKRLKIVRDGGRKRSAGHTLGGVLKRAGKAVSLRWSDD